jgi:hypothetical protein
LKAYTASSSRSWSNSSTVNYRKETGKAKVITDYINQMNEGDRIKAAELIRLSVKKNMVYGLLRILSGQNMIVCRRTQGNLRKWFKKRNLTEKEVQEASSYII